MAGYLDNYGAGEERREKRIKLLVITALAVVVTAGVLYFIFKNYRQERQVNRFVHLQQILLFNLRAQQWRDSLQIIGALAEATAHRRVELPENHVRKIVISRRGLQQVRVQLRGVLDLFRFPR